MAGLGGLLQRIARDLEQAGGQQPADDLRTRLGYGPGGDDDDEDFGAVDESAAAREPDVSWQPDAAGEADTVWEPEPARRPAAAAREPETAWKPAAAAREPETAWKPAAAREPAASRAPASAPAASRAPRDAYRAPSRSPPHLPASPGSLLSERIHARLRTPDALREAFVVKELLDRPLGRRRTG